MAESKTPVANNSLRLKLERLTAYEEHAQVTGKILLPHEGFPRENNGDWVILEENGERFGTVTFKDHAKRGETWNAPDPEGQRRAQLLVRAVNSHQDLLDALIIAAMNFHIYRKQLDISWCAAAKGGYETCEEQACKKFRKIIERAKAD